MKNLRKILMCVLLVLISALTYYGINLLMSDIANYATGFKFLTVSLSFFMLICSFIKLLLADINIRVNEERRKNIFKNVTITILINSILGLVFTILSIFAYNSMFKPYPFYMFIPVMIVVHCALGGLCVYMVKKNGLNCEKQKKKVSEVLFGIFEWIFALYALNKFGAFIFSFGIMEYSMFNKLIVYLISLVLPMCAFMLVEINRIKKLTNKQLMVVSVSILLLSLIVNLLVIVIGMNDTGFVSAVSPFTPFEKLDVLPIDSAFTKFVFTSIPAAFCLALAIIKNERERKKV